MPAGRTRPGATSGTSLAAPHVAGVAAQYLQHHPNATARQVNDAILDDATPGLVDDRGTGSPNLLLHQYVHTAVAGPDVNADRRTDLMLDPPGGPGGPLRPRRGADRTALGGPLATRQKLLS